MSFAYELNAPTNLSVTSDLLPKSFEETIDALDFLINGF
jgi:hypothetical protein